VKLIEKRAFRTRFLVRVVFDEVQNLDLLAATVSLQCIKFSQETRSMSGPGSDQAGRFFWANRYPGLYISRFSHVLSSAVANFLGRGPVQRLAFLP
jgi:hypothetical protein